jgi:restriction system protein
MADVMPMRKIYGQVNPEEREKARLKRLALKKEKEVKHAARQQRQSSNTQVTTPKPSSAVFPDGDNAGVDQSDWKHNLLSAVKAMVPDGFERLSQRLLREAGFTKVEVRGQSGDGGIDGVGVLRANIVSFQVYFQFKKWKGSLGSKKIRDFRGALQSRADKRLFITTGNFTSQAFGGSDARWRHRD